MATKATIAMWGAWLVAPVLAQDEAQAALQRALLIEQKEGDRKAALVDLTIDQEHGHPGCLRLLDRGDCCVRARVVENDRSGMT